MFCLEAIFILYLINNNRKKDKNMRQKIIHPLLCRRAHPTKETPVYLCCYQQQITSILPWELPDHHPYWLSILLWTSALRGPLRPPAQKEVGSPFRECLVSTCPRRILKTRRGRNGTTTPSTARACVWTGTLREGGCLEMISRRVSWYHLNNHCVLQDPWDPKTNKTGKGRDVTY